MEPNVLDRLLDRIQQQERDKLRLSRKLGRAHWQRNQAQAALKQQGIQIVPQQEVKALEADVARLKTQAERRTELHKTEVSRYEAELAKLRQSRGEARGVDPGDKLVGMVESQAERVGELEQKLAERNEQLAALREQRDRLVEDNTALATARNVLRGDREMLEDELRQVRHTLSMEQDLIRELHRDVKLHKAYAKDVLAHSPAVHGRACTRAKLPEDWHEVTDLPTQGEDTWEVNPVTRMNEPRQATQEESNG